MSTVINATTFHLGRKEVVVIHREAGKVEVLVDCNVVPDAYVKIDMTAEQYLAYAQRKKLVQELFPDMSRELREVLITGTTPAEWQEMLNKSEYTKEQLLAFGYVIGGE